MTQSFSFGWSGLFLLTHFNYQKRNFLKLNENILRTPGMTLQPLKCWLIGIRTFTDWDGASCNSDVYADLF